MGVNQRTERAWIIEFSASLFGIQFDSADVKYGALTGRLRSVLNVS